MSRHTVCRLASAKNAPPVLPVVEDRPGTTHETWTPAALSPP